MDIEHTTRPHHSKSLVMEESSAGDNLSAERDHEQPLVSTTEPSTNQQPLLTSTQENGVKSEIESGQDGEPPTKRRRTGDTITPQSKPRAASPPWKNAAAEGPSTFLVGGMRKSARTNALPLDLQPQGDKRATRASVNQNSPNVKSKYASKQQDARPATPASTQNSTKPGHSRTLSSSTQTRISPVKKPTSVKSTEKTGSKRRASKIARSPSPDSVTVKTPRSAQKQISSKVNGKVKRRSSQTIRVGDEAGDDEDQDEEEDDENVESEEDIFEIPTSTPDSSRRPAKIRLTYQPRLPKPQHPSHVEPFGAYGSFKEWLDTEGPYTAEESAPALTDSAVAREASARRAVEFARRPGGLLDGKDPNDPGIVATEPCLEPKQQYTRHDYMVAHALRFRVLQLKEQKKHTTNAHKYAYDAQSKWIASQPKSFEEIQREYNSYNTAVLMATTKQCVEDLKNKWNLFRQDVYQWRHERWKEEEEAQGKENLNRVLQDSKALLESGPLDSADESEETESESDSVDVDGNMSSDDNSIEDEDRLGADDNLTTEQLRAKYESHLQNSDQPSEQDAQPPSDAMEIDDDTLHKGLDFEDEDVKAKIAEAEQDVSQADLSDDESTDMDSESEEDDSESGSGSDGSDEEDVGLAGFFGKAVRTKLQAEAASTESPIDSPAIQVTEVEKDVDINGNEPIPDAAQVQTPVSNIDTPSHLAHDGDKGSLEKESGLHINSTANDGDVMQIDNQGDSPSVDSHMSMPATPISVDMEKKQIPSLEVPHLLRASLREYQKDGFSWLADRYEHGANSILADEMGLGKTIQTITLLAYLALKHEQWGPHLVVVPTSVILNWEMEFKKFLPSFKVLSYYGTQEQRKEKRRGWKNDNKWNVVITSYDLILNDQNSFKMRSWHYLILDEAHNIKNWRSQRWQTLLTFRSHARLLLTGTPLQNNLEELWSLLFFLIGKDKGEDFLGRQEFSLLFKKPADQILEDDQQHLDAEAQEQVRKLHQILRPRLLRRLKADVEKQMPGKFEHVVYCRLSKRQRYLYDGFLSRSQTREALAGGNYRSIINCIMQLRKVCNHPDLFETRPIVTSFAMPRSVAAGYEKLDLFIRQRSKLDERVMVNLDVVDLLPGSNGPVSALDTIPKCRLNALFRLRELVHHQSTLAKGKKGIPVNGSTAASALKGLDNDLQAMLLGDLQHRAYITSLSSQRRPLYSHSLAERLMISPERFTGPHWPGNHRAARLDPFASRTAVMNDLVKNLEQRSALIEEYLIKFTCTTPAVIAPDLFELTFGKPVTSQLREVKTTFTKDAFQEASIRQAIAFPDKRLLQFDCGKLQKLDILLRTLQAGGHRALIFTQFKQILDILEQFLNIHGHRYLRLDGQTKVEDRQVLTERFNSDTSILAFILSSRSGGQGINLTGADAVIFYDLDWNPAMDKQCQDRAHRIGQTRDVHIYRLVSEHTIEVNMLRKQNQKRLLDDVIIQEGDFTTDYLNKTSSSREGVHDPALEDADAEASAAFDRVLGLGNADDTTTARLLAQAEDEEDAAAARIAVKEVEGADARDFQEMDPASNKSTRPSSRARQEATKDIGTTSTKDDSSSNSMITGEVLPRTDMAVDIFRSKQPIGIDRYIVEYLEWEGKDIPFVPVDVPKKKKKRSDDHRVRKRER